MATMATIVLLYISACAFGVGADIVTMEAMQLREGTNFVYAIFGDTQGLASGVNDLLTNLHLSEMTPLCIDVTSTTAPQSFRQIRAKQSQSGDITTIATFSNVERLQNASDLINLDFLFRLPEKSNTNNIVTILLLNTNYKLNQLLPQN